MTDFELRERVRSSTYQQLATLFRPPDETLNHEQVLEKLCTLLDAAAPEAAEHARALAPAWQEEGAAAIRRDHMALFVGPAALGAPPYGSVYLESSGEVMGESTRDVERLYAAAGLQKASGLKDAPDHVRIELDVMHVVIDKTVGAVGDGSWEAAQRLVEVQAALLQNHLSRWVTPFTTRIRKHAATEFHRRLAATLEAFVRQEYLEDAPAMVDEFHEQRVLASA